MTTPVLAIGYNRPDLLDRALSSLPDDRRPIFVAVDGPRHDGHHREAVEDCTRVARAFARGRPNVQLRIRSSNLGCRDGVVDAIDWLFGHVDRGIILEDDCIPAQSFYDYAAELLERHRDERSVGMISGSNPLGTTSRRWSYTLTWFGGVWGWATWANSWAAVHGVLGKGIPDQQIWATVRDPLVAQRFIRNQRRVLAGVDTWDYWWDTARIATGQLCCTPTKNLVANVGFDERATHTTAGPPEGTMTAHEVTLPITDPPLRADRRLDRRLALAEALRSVRARLPGRPA